MWPAQASPRKGAPLKLVVTGSTGFIGSALVPFLARQGYDVTRLVRRDPVPGADEVAWGPESGSLDPDSLAGADAVVHLAGESISAGRWTPERKERIRRSRVDGTTLLSEALASLDVRPQALVCASAKDVYGDRGDEVLNEDSAPGSDFLARSIAECEVASRPAAEAGARVVNLRFGLVLGASGGALARMLLPYKLGMGGRLGSGKQYLGWVSLDDAVRAIHHAATTPSLAGPVNVVAPETVTNREFAGALGRVLSRPAVIPAPGAMLRAIFGEVATTMLASARLDSSKLLSSGFEFQHPKLEGALRAALRRP